MTVKIDPYERFVRQDYKIWDTLKYGRFYDLHYRHEIDDVCEMLNDIYYKYSVVKPFLKPIREQIIAELDKRIATLQKNRASVQRDDDPKLYAYTLHRGWVLFRLKKELEELD